MGLQHSRLEGRDQERRNLEPLATSARLLFEADPAGILLLDSTGCATFANPAALTLLGYDAGELLGQPLDPLLRPESRDGASPALLAQIAASASVQGSAVVSRAIYHRRDGSALAVEAQAFPFPLPFPELDAALVVLRFSPAQTLPASDARLLQALETVGEGVLVFDAQERVDFANAAAERLLGLSRTELIGSPRPVSRWQITDRHGRPLAPDDLPAHIALRDGKPVLEQELELTAGERRLTLSVSAFPLRDEQGAVRGAVAAFRDITARRQAEQNALRFQSATAAFLNSGSFPLLLLDVVGRVDAFNQAADRLARRLTGLALVRGEPAERCLPVADDADNFYACLRKATEGETARFDAPLPLDDEFHWSELRFDPVINPSGDDARVCLSIVPLGHRRRAEGRLRILAEAGALLTSSPDYQQTLANLSRLAVPGLADCCIITVVEPDGRLVQMGASHVLPEKQRLAEELIQRFPVDLSHPAGVAEVVRSGQPLFVPLTSAGFSQAIAYDPEQARLLEALRIRSYLCVPMNARGGTLGALCFCVTESERRFDEADLAVAEELARRAGASLDQARLLRAAQEASRRNDESLALLDTVLETAPVGFALLDTSLHQVRVNNALAAMCGAPPDELVGRRLDAALPPFAAPLREAARQVLASGQPVFDLELSGERSLLGLPAGEPVYWKCQLFPIRVADEELGVGVVVIDISGEQRATEERGRLLEREQAARAEAELAARMIERIQAVSDAALAHLDLDDLLQELLHRVSELMGVDEATILLFDETSQRLVIRAAKGLAVPVDLRRGVPLGEGFVGRIARDRVPIMVERVSEEEVPHPFLVERIASMMGVPLVLEERVIGVLHVGSTGPRLFRPSELRLLQFAADRIALAIDRASLFEAERLAQRRLAFLAEASAILSSTLEVEEALVRVSELAVPEIADVCTINLIEEGGTFRRLSVAHQDPAFDRLAETSVGRFPIDFTNRRITAMEVFRSGRSKLFAEIQPEDLPSIVGDERQVELLGHAPFRSGMMVPLMGGGRAFGMMGFWLTGTQRAYNPSDVALAEDLARRAAEAYERARLYRETIDAVRAREEFLSIASHELKTPLTTVTGYVQMLDRQLRRPEPDVARLRQAVRNLQGQLERFQGLVNDLLDTSQIQRGQLELHKTRFDLAALAGEVLERFDLAPERTEAHGLVLDVEGLEPVVGEWDASRLDQVLTNLISNALKYSPGGGEVRVTVRRDGDQAELVVADHGIGIAEEERRLLFQPFTRGVEATRTASGAGLGLHISAQIVRRHAGSIDVESRPGHGSRFRVRLPLTTPTATLPAS